MNNQLGIFIITLALAMLPSVSALANNAETANKSNNPLNLAPGISFQDYYTPELYNTNDYTNDLFLRGTLPLPPSNFIGVPQLMRVTVPVSTRPDRPGGGYSTGIGDLSLFDIFLLKTKGIQLGIGPLIDAPTASEHELGTGKWQVGLAAVAIDASQQGLLGGLVQYQLSFAGDNERENTESATFQPFVIHNLPQGWYLRSTGIWTFDLHNDKHYIPIGLGAGKAWKVGHNIFNAYIEPQWTVERRGDGLAKFTVLAGLSITLGR